MISGDSASEVVLAREYSQYGEVTSHSSAGESLFAFTGELQAGGLVHLRAREYDPVMGRFIIRDSWEGDYSSSFSLINGCMLKEFLSIEPILKKTFFMSQSVFPY